MELLPFHVQALKKIRAQLPQQYGFINTNALTNQHFDGLSKMH